MMDILLSLPILSFFFSTSATSWSTSLNLLFFYLTWSTLVLSHSALRIQLFGALAIRLVFFLLPALLFLAFDLLLPSLAETVKHGGRPALPPRDPRLLARQLLLALFNVVLQSGLEAAASLGLAYLPGPSPPFRTTTTLPLPFAIIKQLGWLYLAREVLGYYLHRRVLHAHRGTTALPSSSSWLSRLPIPRRLPFLSPSSPSSSSGATETVESAARDTTNYLARKHAAHAHARAAAPYALRLAADHPLPYLLHRFAPTYLPAALLVRPHLLVYLLFVGLVTLEETLTMSGYTIVPGIVMGGITRRNAAHYGAGHRGADSGNYGAWGVLDWGCGTGLRRGHGEDTIEDDLRAEARKHRVRERGEKGASDALEKVGDGIEGLRRGAKGRRKGAKGSSSSGS